MNQPDRATPVGAELIACHECDELQQIPALAPGQTARCHICRAQLLRNPKGGIDRPIALFIAAFILLLLANLFPFMILDIQGQQEITTILGTSQALYHAGMGELAVVVFLTSILAPALIIVSALYVLLAVRFKASFPAARIALSWISHLRPWVMLDVYMLGVLVAFVKLDKMASMHIGLSLFAFAGLIAISTAAIAAFEPQLLWRQLGKQESVRAR